MDFRKTFDTIPKQFDRWRPRYCNELFTTIIDSAKLNSNKSVLEIGPGTGQATEPFLKIGCDYHAIELGEHFTEYMIKKYGSYSNFSIVNDDFETYDFGINKYDLVFSAATIQWIPEKIALTKIYNMLKPGGILAMFMTCSDEKSSNEELYEKINKAYAEHFHVETKYTCKFNYENVVNYGFVDYNYCDWKKARVFDADEYISYIGTHVEHITLQEPYKSRFYSAIRQAVMDAGNKIIINDTIALYLARKPR